MEAGDALAELWPQIARGQRETWLRLHCGFGQRTAQVYMRVAQHREEIAQSSARLSLAGALRLIGGGKKASVQSGKSRKSSSSSSELNSLAWSDATLQQRRHFLDAGGVTTLIEAMPESFWPALSRAVAEKNEALGISDKTDFFNNSDRGPSKRVREINRKMKLGEDNIRKLPGTSLSSAKEQDELVVLNRGAPPGELTDEVRILIERAVAGEAVSALARSAELTGRPRPTTLDRLRHSDKTKNGPVLDLVKVGDGPFAMSDDLSIPPAFQRSAPVESGPVHEHRARKS
jgi:hypothetical protein